MALLFLRLSVLVGRNGMVALQGRAKSPQRGVHADALHHDIYL